MSSYMKSPSEITCLISHPLPQKLTLWEWLGVKKRPPIVPQRLYAVIGSTVFVSNEKGEFDFSVSTHQKEPNHDNHK
jgi:hypothetical protein